ncbi:Hypothetical predicted protein [Paramuricea clavata]|uniref:Uncharacterized protein n=1 Tax=Paramuricea clavata TaxID=317549 RepID=A0A7D9LG11_PARCT|nr:Hypothetical predicted protein [Paramuricea clavata]
MLNPKYFFQALKGIPFTPVIDLFASHINKQFDQYVSYRPDPFASDIDAFTISWADTNFYCFPPFSCILRVARKIIRDRARGVLVVRQWPNTVMVPHTLTNTGATTSCPFTSSDSVTAAVQASAETPSTQEAKTSYLSCIRGKLQIDSGLKCEDNENEIVDAVIHDPKEIPQQFVLFSLDFKTKIGFASKESDCEVQYDEPHIQKTL